MKFVKINDVSDRSLADLNLQSFLLLSRYYSEYYGRSFSENSFIIYEGSEVQTFVFCCIIDNKITLPDSGCQVIWVKNFSEKEKKNIYKTILSYLSEIAKKNDCTKVIIKDEFADNNSLSLLGKELFNQKFHSRLTFEMNIKYKGFQSQVFNSNIRNSYRSLINWGKNNLDILVIDKHNPCLDSFLNFQNFHKKISGRQTRSNETWKNQYNMLEKGFGEALLAYYKNELVSASLFMDVYKTSLYFTGAYERELFKYGISHYLLLEGICRSFQRANTTSFSLGYFDTDIKDSKWYNIQFFKKGFCRDLKPVIFWSKEV